MTCKKGSLHINEDLVKLQLYNKDGSKTAPGETCIQSVVTDLHKKSQPIIRFELNDLIRLAEEKCPCGSSFRVIDQIFGRADDLFWGVDKANGEWNYIFPDYIRRAIITTSESIIDYQAIQQSPTKIIVRLVLAEQYDSSVFDKIIKHITEVFNSHNCLQPEIRIKREKPVIHPESLKLIRVVRDFTIN
jgi:phenylacetate-coenzyme A ligase PaaK-like adenylate-forming protein